MTVCRRVPSLQLCVTVCRRVPSLQLCETVCRRVPSLQQLFVVGSEEDFGEDDFYDALDEHDKTEEFGTCVPADKSHKYVHH